MGGSYRGVSQVALTQSQTFEEEAEVWTSYAAVRKERSAEVEEYIVCRHHVAALADTCQSWKRVGRYYLTDYIYVLMKIMGLAVEQPTVLRAVLAEAVEGSPHDGYEEEIL
jgi:hypothetical protein